MGIMIKLLWTFTVLLLATNASQFLGDDIKECRKPGPFCDSCTSHATCIKIGDKGFRKTKSLFCAADQTCMDTPNGPACTKEENVACDPDYRDLPFPCSDQGVFPHPVVWEAFVYCVPSGPNGQLQAVVSKCPDGEFVYNPKTTYCDFPAANATGLPIPLCKDESEIKALEANPTIFYECSVYDPNYPKLYPFQHLCPNGFHYIENDYQCEKPKKLEFEYTDDMYQ